MNLRNKQQGSAHVLIIIVLVLALITALGWIFWHKFIQKTDVMENQTLQTSKESTKPAGYEPVIPEGWYVESMSASSSKGINVQWAVPENWRNNKQDGSETSVEKFAADADIPAGGGALLWVRYSSAEKEWQTIETDANNEPVVRKDTLVKRANVKAEGKYETAHFTTGDALTAIEVILVLRGNSIYQFSLPPTDNDQKLQDEKFNSVNSFIRTIKFLK